MQLIIQLTTSSGIVLDCIGNFFTIFGDLYDLLEVGYQSPPIGHYFWGGWVPGPPKGPHFEAILVHPQDPKLAEIGTQPLAVLSGVLLSPTQFQPPATFDRERYKHV